MTISKEPNHLLTESYEDYLVEHLQDPAQVEGYLNAALEDPDPRVFQLALQDVLKAHSCSMNDPKDLGEIKEKLAALGYQLKIVSVP